MGKLEDDLNEIENMDLKPMKKSPVERGVIKPCPFCGSEPIGPHAGDSDWWIECERCEIVMDNHSKRALIDNWNERAL